MICAVSPMKAASTLEVASSVRISLRIKSAKGGRGAVV